MLENRSLFDVIAMMLSVPVLSLFLDRVPLWRGLPSEVKLWFFRIVPVLTPGVLAVVTAKVPPDVLAMTPLALVIGGATWAITQFVHKVDLAIGQVLE